MNILDDLNKIKQLDPKNVYTSVELLSAQVKQAWEEVSAITFPEDYQKINKIVFSGMGGSALAAYVLKSLYLNDITLPFEIVNDYHLPAYVDSHTLVILGSYSGTTEETLSSALEARQKNALATGLTTGGDLASFFRENNYPAYIYDPKNNPSAQPRLGTGYGIAALISIFTKLNLLNVTSKEIEDTVLYIKSLKEKYTLSVPLNNNPAKKLALNLYQKTPLIITAGHLTNTGRVIRNQIHETSKSFASWYDLPELNHHLLESLQNPQNIGSQAVVFIIDSALYPSKIALRIKVSEQVFVKNNLTCFTFKPVAGDKLSQCLEVIVFGGYLSFYLAMLNGVDPSRIPWVDYFKSELKKS